MHSPHTVALEANLRSIFQTDIKCFEHCQGRIIQGAKGGYSPGAPQDRGHHKIGGTTLTDFMMYILVAFSHFPKGHLHL